MFVKLQSKDTPIGNEENYTFITAISCIGKDLEHLDILEKYNLRYRMNI